MSFCTYIASDSPLRESPVLWPLSLEAQDILYRENMFATATQYEIPVQYRIVIKKA